MIRIWLLVLCTALSFNSGLVQAEEEMTYNDTVISNPLGYCFASNNTVGKKADSKAQLTIVEDDGD